MWQYEVTTVWHSKKEGRLHAGGNPEIEIATPPEFGGPQNMWSPENLLAGAVGACLMTSTLYFIERSGITLLSYMSNATGTMEKTREGLAFTGVEVQVSISVASEAAVEVVRGAVAKAELSCPISRSLDCPVTISVDIHVPKEVSNANL